MAQSSVLQVALSAEKLDFVKARVETGEYSSASELVEEGIAVLQDRDAEFELWAREIAVPAYDRLVADPSRAVTLDQVRANLEARRRALQLSR